jgi:glycosyltransferase involved in cell wall biosynthesis
LLFQQKLKSGFGVFFDPTKTTSGQRFYSDLCKVLEVHAAPLERHPTVVLFNISAPWKEILKAKLIRQKVVLRVDGLYCDRLCQDFVKGFRWPLSVILGLGLRFVWAHDFLASLANFLNQNHGGFLRILLADRIIYQSVFSKKIHQRYFPGKASHVIVNGSSYVANVSEIRSHAEGSEIRVVAIYDDWKPAKRICDIVGFVEWANLVKRIPIRLTLLGYTGKVPIGSPRTLKETIETRPYIKTLPRFKCYNAEFAQALTESDMYLSFSYRDPCPNVVVEAMAYGLPVVGLASGGVPDIVGDAGILLPVDDFDRGFFSAHRYEHEFPPIDFEQVLEAIQNVMDDYEAYRARVRDRFTKDLEIDVVAQRYAAVMNEVLDYA